jgi:hypothetical protein
MVATSRRCVVKYKLVGTIVVGAALTVGPGAGAE